ncbi:hypothetical protein CLRAG_03420 [Clostridium ragsdalei P11]|uniref:AAA+ ATPase domain-containing protein n=1 Tax=Clostridium ragsdalei P11 TaxID=1353534 RepID=A0A1A6B3I4_9CLOT|nr:AAA family ATPase [Clostridium ragsdalei]OBR96833.1 hypothetical protein CLRAG_03420 [Clostridium ragsdalei P11]
MIKNVKWNNHYVLDNLELDFSKPDGTLYNTILLAGENGTGKTTILETLGAFLNLGSIEPFKYIRYVVDGVPYLITPKDNPMMGFHLRKNENDGTEIGIYSNRNNNKPNIDRDTFDIRHYGCAYSKARSGFRTQKITATTMQQLDEDKYEEDSKEDFTFIKQLIVDIDTQDNSNWMNITKAGIDISFPEFQKSSKKYRFEKAFNDFFDIMKFVGVDNTSSDEKKIVFEKNGKKISVDDLSTGEKQIVFRGAHLLKNSNNLNGGIILIDEPELSMHPKWQEKILQYYRNLFTNDRIQTAQLIIATHSEYVLRSALNDPDNVLIIALSQNAGNIEAKRITAPSVLPTITSAENNYLVFGIVSTDYHIELYGYLQSKENKTSVKACDEYIAMHPSYDPLKHGKPSSHTAHGNTTNYKTLPTYIRNAIDHPDSGQTYTQDELKTSIELLIKLCR